jgi:hypothetical protein
MIANHATSQITVTKVWQEFSSTHKSKKTASPVIFLVLNFHDLFDIEFS